MKNILMISALGIVILFLSSANTFAQRKVVSGREITGIFRMSFSGEFSDSFNEIKILALGGGKIKVQFDLTYPSRFGKGKDDITANVGQAIGEAKIDGDTAVYSTNEDGGSCKITIKFAKPGQLKVLQNQEGGGCGFGLNVSAQGVYKKTSSAKPKFAAEY